MLPGAVRARGVVVSEARPDPTTATARLARAISTSAFSAGKVLYFRPGSIMTRARVVINVRLDRLEL